MKNVYAHIFLNKAYQIREREWPKNIKWVLSYYYLWIQNEKQLVSEQKGTIGEASIKSLKFRYFQFKHPTEWFYRKWKSNSQEKMFHYFQSWKIWGKNIDIIT